MTAISTPSLETAGVAGERMQTPWSGGVMLSGVTGHFSAAHHPPKADPLGQQGIHGHTWQVTAWFRNDCRSDVRIPKAALDALLRQWDHKLLPENLSWGEDLAYAIGRLANCVEVEVSRPLEGFHARWTA